MAVSRKLIFAGYRETGIDQDDRHDFQERITGKRNLKDMSADDLSLIVTELKKMGFVPKSGKRNKAARKDVRYCHVLWRLLVEAGHAKVPGPSGLNKFIRARFENTWGKVPIDIDAMKDWQEINDVIQALKDWCSRAGIDPEGGH